MAHYIQRRGNGRLETVDEFETAQEAKAMVAEYRMSDPSANYYVSTRCCKDWKESTQSNPELTMTKRQHIEAQRLKPIGVEGIEACRRIATEGPMKINEVMVDAFSASAIVSVYDALNETNRANLAGRCVVQVVDMCFKLINKQRRAA